MRFIKILLYTVGLAAIIVAGVYIFQGISSKQNIPPSATDTPQTLTVSVYFTHKNLTETDCAGVLPVKRVLPYTTGVARAAVRELFIGPTLKEKQAGYASIWESDPSLLKSITIQDGIAYVDLADIRTPLNTISSSCGSAAARAQLTATLEQFTTIHDVRIAINENPQTFYDWIQLGCTPENDYCNPAPFILNTTSSWERLSQDTFTITYPPIFTQTKGTITIPSYTHLYPSTTLTYTIPVPYCNLAGTCVPYTTPSIINIAHLSLPYTTAYDALAKTLSPEPFRVTSYHGSMASLGAEGEGIYYYLIPLGTTDTLMITRRYMDESILANYKNTPAFIPFTDQEKIVETMITTLTVNP